MTDEIRADVLKELRQAAETNNVAADKYRADADKKQAEANEMRARAGYFTAMADRWDRLATFIENGTFDLDYLLSGDDLGEARKANEAARDADVATEAFVDVADAERYAQRDEYVNSNDDEDGMAAAAQENAEHDPRSCTECVDQYEAEQAEDAELAAREAEAADEVVLAGELPWHAPYRRAPHYGGRDEDGI